MLLCRLTMIILQHSAQALTALGRSVAIGADCFLQN
jgi:hypothetical protein